ncbi:MAG: AEC family transporter [Desulfobacterales bacterium]|nr:AEC family transporter [Desulfobacterales bacterium]
MNDAFQNIFSMYFILIAAYVLQKMKPYPVAVINDLIFYLFLPVTVFYSIVHAPQISWPIFIKTAAAGFCVLLLSALVAAMISKYMGVTGGTRKTFLLGASYGNHAFIGFPVVFAFSGENGLLLALFYLIGTYVYLYSVGFYLMTGHITLSGFVRNPLVISLAAALLCAALEIKPPPLMLKNMELMNRATFPLSMVVVGGGLQLNFFAKTSTLLLLAAAGVVRLIVSPLIATAVGMVLSFPIDQLGICILQSAMPTGVLVTIFSLKYKGDPAFSNALVSLSTLLSIALIPLLFVLLQQRG